MLEFLHHYFAIANFWCKIKTNNVSKYKYYLKKPKVSIAQDILLGIALAGAIIIAGNSPYFVPRLIRSYFRWRKRAKQQRAFQNAFYRLRRLGYIKTEQQGRQIYISLTEEGRRKAGRFQINHLKVNRPKRWDRRWRILLFDIEELHKSKREALRGILKELNFYPLQKSVWVHAFSCRDEVELLKDFFGLTSKHIRLIEVSSLDGAEEDMKRFFNM